MNTLVSSVGRLVDRIKEYQEQADEMAVRMTYNRAWYAVHTEEGWAFGPSKFVGYDDLNASEYLSTNGSGLDGRITEGVLQQWSELVEKGHPQYDELRTALNEFFAGFGKKPNEKARISIVRLKDEATAGPLFTDDLVALMVAVYKKLTPAQKSAFRKEAA